MISKVLKAIWVLFENICFAIGLFILISALTTVLNGGTISIKKDEKPVYCYSTDKTKCVDFLSEENKHD